ncbi:hypothetical protein N0V86_000412 [Didymella sp. IMI 355093]|nr:hypothetical protein N0V86_000412 [Didymella sp. IMI 355093]
MQLSDAIGVEPQADNVTLNGVDGVPFEIQSTTHLALEQSSSENVAKNTTWEVVKQEILPSYIRSVSFVINPDDLNSERQKDLDSRFPGVLIVTESSPVETQLTADQWLQRNVNDRSTPAISTSATPTKPPELKTSIQSVVEVIPTTPIAIPTGPRNRPSLLSRITSGPTEPQFRGPGSPTSSIDNKMFDKSPILRVAKQIGLISDTPGTVIHAIWLQWQKHEEVKPFSTIRKGVNKGVKLVQYYNNLVTLYILAFHKEEFDMCFALLLRFQSTNYNFRNEFPDLSTAVLAFQYLPEDNDLCRWIATLFAFLWRTQDWDSREHILNHFPNIDKEALSRFLFAIAYIRDPHTKGHNTAVLAQWCAVHQHEEGDDQYRTCRKEYNYMEDQFNKIRSEEAEHEYDEAKNIVDGYIKSLRSHSRSVDDDQSTPVASAKRKAKNPVVPSHKKYKRGGGRGGFMRSLS